MIVREHERTVLLHLGRGDARRAVVEFRREDRLADRIQVARDDADLAVVLRLEREEIQLLRELAIEILPHEAEIVLLATDAARFVHAALLDDSFPEREPQVVG